MRKRTTLLITLGFIFITGVQISCRRDDPADKYGEQTAALVSIVNSNPNIKSMLIKSIDQAKIINPDKITNPAQTLDEYYEFVTWAETAMPFSIIPTPKYSRMISSTKPATSSGWISEYPVGSLNLEGLNSRYRLQPFLSTWK